MTDLFLQLSEKKKKLEQEKERLLVSSYHKTKEKIAQLESEINKLTAKELDQKIKSCSHYFIMDGVEDNRPLYTCVRCTLTNHQIGNPFTQSVMNRNMATLTNQSFKVRGQYFTEDQQKQFFLVYQGVIEQYPMLDDELLEEEINHRLKNKAKIKIKKAMRK